MKIPKHIEEILKQYDIPAKEALWDCHGTLVMLHRWVEVVADRADITLDEPVEIHVALEKKEMVIRVTGHRGKKSAWSYGEVSPANNRNSYPAAMAEKRAKDRVIIKLAGLHGLYSDVEADEFKKSDPEPKAPAKPKTKPKAKAKAGNGDVAREIREAVTNIAASKTVDRLFPEGLETSGTSGKVLAVCNTANECHTLEELKEHFEEVATLKNQMPEKEQQFANEIFKKERDRINATP